MVNSIARGRRWLAELMEHPAATAESIAKREGCSPRKVNMTISLAFLAPDLVQAALKRSEEPRADAVMVGDTPWDIHAAGNAGVDTIAVLTGGFAIEELKQSGAVQVFESVIELCQGLNQTPLR